MLAADKQTIKTPPQQVVIQAHRFTQTLGRFTQLPSSVPKKTYVRYLAEDKKDDIQFNIARNNYQNTLYKNLEEADLKTRRKFSNQLSDRQKKIDNNQVTNEEKRNKQVEVFEKHCKEVLDKHIEIQRNKVLEKNDAAFKLRKQLLEFYDKEKQRKTKMDHAQVKVQTCYTSAVRRIDDIHKKNQQYAMKSEREHMQRMHRNDGKQRNLMYLSRMKSVENRKKEDIYVNNCEIMQENQLHFIQTYCKDLDLSIKAFDVKDERNHKQKQRLQKFFKERVEKWHQSKQRVDEQKAQVPTKCLNILDKTTKASFRQTHSSFKESGKQWYQRVQQNKSAIYENDEMHKDLIMQEHLDRRLRNNSISKVDDTMGSMRDRAKKLSAITTTKMSSSAIIA